MQTKSRAELVGYFFVLLTLPFPSCSAREAHSISCPLAKVLSEANDIYVYGRGASATWSRTPIAYATNRQNPAILLSFKQSQRAQSPLKCFAKLRIVVVDSDHSEHLVSFSCGAVTDNQDTIHLEPKASEWLNSLIKHG